MNVQRALFLFTGAIISFMLAMMVIWFSKKSIAKTMSRRHILHTLKMHSMSGKELIDTAMEYRSALISPKLVPVMLVKLQKEGLIQREVNNRYVITSKGLESLKTLDAMSREFQKVAMILQKTSMTGKFFMIEAIDRVRVISGMNSIGVPGGFTPVMNEQFESASDGMNNADGIGEAGDSCGVYT